MAKSYNVSFNILGNLDPSLLASIKKAQESMESLGKLNGKALANAQKLANLQSKADEIANYRALQKAMKDAQAARTTELLTAANTNSAYTKSKQKLDDMKRGMKELAKTQKRLQDNSALQRRGVEIARAGLKNAKKSGDIDSIKAAQDALARQQEAARRARDELKEVNAAIRQGKNELRDQQREVKSLSNNFTQSNARAQQLQQQLQQQHQQLAQLRTTLPTGNLANQEAQLRTQIQQTTNALNAEIAALERRNQIQANFSQRQQDLSNAYSNFQNSLQTAQTIMNPFVDAANNAMTFEKAMSRLKSLTQMRNLRSGNITQANEEMASLKATIEKLGATTEYTAVEAAEAANYFAMAGWSSKMIEAMLPTATDLASIAQMPMGRVADMLSDDMTAFGIKAGESYTLASGKVVDGAKFFGDAVAYATTQANMDLSTFHEAWKYNAPTAHAMNLSLGESIAQNMIAANAGIKGSMAGTSFRQFWVRLSAPPKAAQKSMEEMGMTASDATKTIREMQEAMAEAGVDQSSDLFTKIEQLENFYQEGKKAGRDMTGWLKGLTGQTALSGVQSLFDTGKLDEAKRYAHEIDSGWIEGWSGDTAKVMRDNTQTSIEYLKSALDALQRSAGDALLPAIRSAAEYFNPLVTSAAEWVAQHPQVVQACAAIATAVASATVALAGFSLAMAGVRFAQAGFATAALMAESLKLKALSLVTVLRGLTLANIGASLSTGLTAATTAASAFGTAMLGAARAALAFVFTPVGAALTALALAAYYAYTHWSQLSPAISQVINTISGLFAPVSALGTSFSNLISHFAPLGTLADTLASAIGGTLCGAFITLAGVVGTVVATVVNLFSDLVKTVVDAVNNIIEVFDALADKDFSRAFKGLKTLGSDFADDFTNIGTDFVNTIAQGAKGTNHALEIYTQPQPQTSNGVGAIQAQLATPPFDVTPVEQFSQSIAQANLPAQEFGNSIAMTSPTMNELSNATAMTSPEMLNVATAAQSATPPIDGVGQSSANASPPIDGLGSSSNSAQGNIQALAGCALSACVGVSALSGAASAVAGALQSAAAQISSIHISVPTVSYFPMTPGTSLARQNAEGGIYGRGAFLTWFAEDSPEAAIPIENSARAYNLWTQAGQLAGFISNEKKPTPALSTFNFSNDYSAPSEPAATFNITINVNVSGNGDKDEIKSGIREALPEVRQTFDEMYRAWQHEQRRRSFA
ncbi:MAG: phage tail tape measure protein [Selenomonadaceae bacterium]|nr:phage tail tape measure protein [Selenomonadaceae bacterium]